jgi:hypothetical protein
MGTYMAIHVHVCYLGMSMGTYMYIHSMCTYLQSVEALLKIQLPFCHHADLQNEKKNKLKKGKISVAFPLSLSLSLSLSISFSLSLIHSFSFLLTLPLSVYPCFFPLMNSWSICISTYVGIFLWISPFLLIHISFYLHTEQKLSQKTCFFLTPTSNYTIWRRFRNRSISIFIQVSSSLSL